MRFVKLHISFGASNETFGASNETFGASNETFGASNKTFGASNKTRVHRLVTSSVQICHRNSRTSKPDIFVLQTFDARNGV
jgi:hypothetical protein